MTRLRVHGGCAVVCLIGLLRASAADAQTIPSSYRFIEHGQEVAVFWGQNWLNSGSLDLGPKGGGNIGGRYLIEASGPLFFEGLVAYAPTTRDVIDPRRAEGDRSIGEADVHMVTLDARLGFSLTGRRTWNRLSPYLFVGGGVAHDAAGSDPLNENLLAEDVFDFGTAFTASAGLGMRLALSTRIMLRADGSFRLWQLQTPAGFDNDDKQLEGVEEDEWVGGYGVALSAAWRF